MKKIITSFILLICIAVSVEGASIELNHTAVKANKGKSYTLKANCADMKAHFKGKSNADKDNYSWRHDEKNPVVSDVVSDSVFTTSEVRVETGKATGIKSGDSESVMCSSKCDCSDSSCMFTIA